MKALIASVLALTASHALAQAQTRALTLGAVALSVLLGVAGGVAAVLLFTSGVTRRAAQLEGNAERLAGGCRCCRPARAATP